MLILFVTSELEGFAKTGGMGDSSRALPLALKNLGHDVRIVLPYYRQIAETIKAPICIESLCVPMGNSDVYCAVREWHLKEIPVYLLEHDGFFDRPRLYDGLYNDGVWSYVDNADRYAFLSKAALQVCKSLSFRPQVVHAHDWQTSLVPFFLKVHEVDGFYEETVSVLTIHSAFIQGKFFSDKRNFIGVPAEYFTSDTFEDYGGVNFMKAGIYFADKINAVSPGYTAELLTPEGAHGLHEYFRRRKDDLRGILNGCDYSLWNPGADPYIPANFDSENLSGKKTCKTVLQRDVGLEVDANRPLFGMVCRLSYGKGFDYLIPAMREVLKDDIQFVVLGSGEPSIERDLRQLVADYPRKAAYRGYDDRAVHGIHAGCDFFLMPSLFEACPNSVLYSMSYGAIPIVRAVGGLKDLVEDVQKSQKGTGFVFENPYVEELCLCMQRAILAYRDRPKDFHALIRRTMQKRFEWHSSAQQYVKMYRDALEMRWLKKLLSQLDANSSVLDLGCGSGDPADVEVSKEHQITGVDISQAQINLARQNVPTGNFLHGDAGSVEFLPASFDAVISFHTLEHIPRKEHKTVLRRIHQWLRPGGLLLISIGAGEFDDVTGEWLGVPMFISCFDPETMRQLVKETDFEILETAIETQVEQNHDVPYLILARKE